MNLHEAYLAKATEFLAKAKVTREAPDKAGLKRIAEIYFHLAARAERSTCPENVIKHRKNTDIKKFGSKRSYSVPIVIIE